MKYFSISEPVTSEMLLGDLILEEEEKHKCYGHNCVLVFPVLAAFSCVYFDYLKVIF